MKPDKLASVSQAICGHLAQRTAVLFLGSGVNFGTRNPTGNTFPMAAGLAESICRDLLNVDSDPMPLDESAEIARYQLGDEAFNAYLFKLFDAYQPSNAHLAIVQMPWDCVYTTNYDLLVEKAALSSAITAAGSFRAVMSATTSLTNFGDSDIIYYKIHGSIDLANTKDGRIILTKEDFRHYETSRKPLFRRLAKDLLRKTFIFVGYSFSDPNFRTILDDCKQQLDVEQFPLSYAVRPSFNTVEEAFWREKYNIQLVNEDAFQFLTSLKDSWVSESRTVVSYEERCSTLFALVDQTTSFPQVGDSFYRVVPSECNGASDAQLFFEGGAPSWADTRDGVAPKRDAYISLIESLFADMADPASPASSYLVTGHAGTGKTTLIRTAAFEIANDYHHTVLIHIADTPLDARLLVPFVDQTKLQRLIVVVQHASNYIHELDAFLDEARKRKLPVSLVLEERKNQWTAKINQAGFASKRLAPVEFELGALSDREIETILDALARYKALGRLSGTRTEHQVEHFKQLADKELLVALRELTVPGHFDDIIRDEFQKIPSEIARKAYVYVSAVGQIQLGLRHETTARLLKIYPGDLGSKVFRPADGVLITGDATGWSRHNAGFQLTARHPVIASVIFASALSTDTEKFQTVSEIIGALDPGYAEDRRILEGIVRKKELVNTFTDIDRRRELYDLLESVLPNHPFVLQHRSILERDLQHPDNAISYARQAVALERRNPALQNTLGLALEFGARDMGDKAKRQVLIGEATRIFEDGIQRSPHDPYSYVGKLNIIRFHELEMATDQTERAALQAKALLLLEEAFEVTNESAVIATLLAEQRMRFGNVEESVKMLSEALASRPDDSRVRDLLIGYLSNWGKDAEALKIALDGVKYDPNSWRLQRHIARLMRRGKYAIASIKSAYEAAVRHRKSDIALRVEQAAYLFMNGQTVAATEAFDEIRRARFFTEEMRVIREWWKDDVGKAIVFHGKVQKIRGGTAYALAIPGNFEAFFWCTESWIAALGENAAVSFHVGFNGFGPVARILARKT